MEEKKDKYADFYKSYEWRRARYDALKASDGKCQLCGRSKHDDITLNVDHIIALRRNWKRRADPSNLQVLCHECNHGKGNRDATDWRGIVPRDLNVSRKQQRKRKKKRTKKRIKGRFEPGTFGLASDVRTINNEDYAHES